MGCAESREHSGPNTHHHRRKQHHPSSSYYDWEKEEGGYIPYRFQNQRRRRWHAEEKERQAQKVRDAAERERNRRALKKHYNADDEKAKLKIHYNEHVGRKLEEAYGQQVRDAAERERHREALGYYDVHERKGDLRRAHDEERRRKAAKGRTEEIKVYASPDLKSRWSEYSK